MSDPFDSGTTGIALALDVPFPANVTSGPGVKVDKTTGNWKVSLDYPPLADVGVPPNPSALYLAVYDTTLPGYERIRLDNIIAGATGLDSRTPCGDANYTILVTDRYVALTAALTAFRTWTLPPAASVPPGRTIVVQDEAGGITGQNHLNFLPTGADTIDGLANYRLKAKFGGLAFRADGTSKWSIAYAWQTTFVADTAYAVQQGDLIVAYASLSAPRIVTLPAANAYPAGQRLTVIDYSGACSATNIISITRVGADTINGAASQSITLPYGYVALISDGTSKWTIVDAAVVAGSQIAGAINGVTIGATTPSTGAFTTLSATTSLTAPNLVINSGAPRVCGRLTLTTGVPVLTGAVAAAATVYFTPYEGNLVPLWNGTQFVWTPCAELSNILANSSTGSAGPAAAAASQAYDLYAWSNAGTPTLTRSPPWSAGTAGSNTVRGTGAGGSALTRVNGILVNVVAVTNGPGAAAGTYVGTIATDSGGGTVSWSLGGSGAGGVPATLNVWNEFNRVQVGPQVTDSNASWTQTSATAGALDASNGNRITLVSGLAEDGIGITHSRRTNVVNVVSAAGAIGFALDATNVLDRQARVANNTAVAALQLSISTAHSYPPQLGVHFIQATQVSDGTNVATFFGGVDGAFCGLWRA